MKVEIKKITKGEDFLQARINNATAFNFRVDANCESNKEAVPFTDVYGAFVDGKLVSNIYAHKFQMMCHGEYLPMCGIGAVNSLIEYRNNGFIRKLMHTILDDFYSAGYVYSYLYPFSKRYYSKFGYGPGGCHVNAEIPTERLDNYKCDYDVSLYKPGDSYQPYEEVYEKFAKQYTGLVAKNDREWLCEYEPARTGKSMFLFSEKGNPKAYLGFENFYEKGGHLLTHGDIAWESPEAFRNILGFLYKLRMHNDVFKVTLPEAFPIDAVLEEVWELKQEKSTTGQVRILNIQKALENYPCHDEKGCITINVIDDYFTSQSGVYRITFGGGNKPDVRVCDDNPDIEFDISALSPLLLGSYGFDDLLYFPKGLVKVNNNIPLLKKVFTRKPVFFTERF